MTHPASTTCKGCNRVVFVTDVDAKGRCCFCSTPRHWVSPVYTGHPVGSPKAKKAE